MRCHNEHLDYLPLIPGGPVGFYAPCHPPCNEVTTWVAVISVLASAAGGAISYQSSQTQAKQAEYNADSQAKAIAQEQARQAAEDAENRRRAVVEQRRIRAAQLNAMAGSGAMLGTGSSLALEVDTWAKQQTELADQQRMNELAQRQLAYQASSTRELGQQQAAAYRREGTGAAIAGLANTAGSAYSSWSTRPKRANSSVTVGGMTSY